LLGVQEITERFWVAKYLNVLNWECGFGGGVSVPAHSYLSIRCVLGSCLS
jgi:hypothetical protein